MKSLKKIYSLQNVSLIFSCTDLEEELIGDITKAVTVSAPNIGGAAGGGNDALAGAYAQLQWSGTANHFSYFSIQGLPSDEMAIAAKGGDWYDGGVLVQMHRHTFDPTNGIIEVREVDRISNRVGAAPLTYQYFRGNQYTKDFIGNDGRVKIVTTPGGDAPQSTRAELYAFVESELLAALGTTEITANTTFSDTGLPASGSVYRVNRYAALGFLTKLYLNHAVYLGTESTATYT